MKKKIRFTIGAISLTRGKQCYSKTEGAIPIKLGHNIGHNCVVTDILTKFGRHTISRYRSIGFLPMELNGFKTKNVFFATVATLYNATK